MRAYLEITTRRLVADRAAMQMRIRDIEADLQRLGAMMRELRRLWGADEWPNAISDREIDEAAPRRPRRPKKPKAPTSGGIPALTPKQARARAQRQTRIAQRIQDAQATATRKIDDLRRQMTRA